MAMSTARTAIMPSNGSGELARKLNVPLSDSGFFAEAHVKLRPVESQTRGIYLCGCGQGPKDIPDSIAQAGCAAAKVLSLLSAGRLSSEAQIATVNEEICAACGACVHPCPYDARELDHERNVAEVADELCQGCGACVAACPNKACEVRNLTTRQIGTMIDQLSQG